MAENKNFLDLEGLAIYDELIKNYIKASTEEVKNEIETEAELNNSWGALGK